MSKMEILKRIVENPNTPPWMKEAAEKELGRLDVFAKELLKRLSQPLPEFKLTKEPLE